MQHVYVFGEILGAWDALLQAAQLPNVEVGVCFQFFNTVNNSMMNILAH
jgi:hypothetical protein